MSGKPVYDFLGYKMINFNYERNNDGDLNSFSIKANKVISNNVYNLFYLIELGFDNNDSKTKATFVSTFIINDLEWLEEISKVKMDVNVFASVSFPYIRSMIYSITNDSRKGAEIPVLDLRKYDLGEGVIFHRTDKN